ncbi:MAG: sulfurtransferase TusA family protein [Anaerolineales bacterium]|nr:sulfurtransferase TusA family protein [Anaerolineales bacterium]
MPDLVPDDTLDCRGEYCPVPVTRTAAKVRSLQPGQVLAILGEDPGMQIDIPAWCSSNGHYFLGIQKMSGYVVCTIRVGGV